MTKTINGKRLLMIATMTVLVSGLTIAAALDDAEAKKPKTGEHKLKCKSIGSWFNPELTGGSVISSSEGKCSAGLSKVTSASLTEITVTVETPPGCLTLSTAEDISDFSMGKKGFIEYTTTGTQCFFAEDGVTPVPAGTDFCGDSSNIWFSTVTGTIAIHNGLVKDTPLVSGEIGSDVGGSANFVSEANHCAGDTAPDGNSFTTKLEGKIIFS
jgi:hypothetical protein